VRSEPKAPASSLSNSVHHSDDGRGSEPKEGKEVDWQRLMPPRGFRVLPRRWVVERTFAWISHNRRMSKDYERLCATGEAFVYAAMTRLMVRRLARG
jgi:transposase